MPKNKTKAHLSDGRHIKVPSDYVDDWGQEARDGNTTLGLADWYTGQGENHKGKIRGSVKDEYKCDHDTASHRISNESQIHEYVKDKPLRMLRTCHRRACIIDGMAWVEHGTGERAAWAPPYGEYRFCAPDSDQSTNYYQLPLDPTAARKALDDGEEFLTVQLLLDMESMLARATQEDSMEDLAHSQAFTFGLTNDSTITIVGVSMGQFLVEYTTNIAQALAELDGEDD